MQNNLPEDVSVWSRSDAVHGAGFKVNETGAGNIFASCGFIVVHIDALQLEVRVTVVGAGWVNAVLVWDHLPELKKIQYDLL